MACRRHCRSTPWAVLIRALAQSNPSRVPSPFNGANNHILTRALSTHATAPLCQFRIARTPLHLRDGAFRPSARKTPKGLFTTSSHHASPAHSKSSASGEDPRDTSPSRDETSEKPPWAVQKTALAQKFPAGWSPRKRLSPDALAGIRALHRQFPDEFTTAELARRFEVSPEAIRRILKSKWVPTVPEEEARLARWVRRGKSVWERYAALGMKAPRRWREEGVGFGGPRRRRWLKRGGAGADRKRDGDDGIWEDLEENSHAPSGWKTEEGAKVSEMEELDEKNAGRARGQVRGAGVRRRAARGIM